MSNDQFLQSLRNQFKAIQAELKTNPPTQRKTALKKRLKEIELAAKRVAA